MSSIYGPPPDATTSQKGSVELSGGTALSPIVKNSSGTTGLTSAVTTAIEVSDNRYNNTLHTSDNTAHTIFTLAADNFAAYADMDITAYFSGRDTSVAARFFGIRHASFQNEGGTCTQVGTTETLGTDRGGLSGGGGATATISVSGGNIILQVNGNNFPTDWCVFIDVKTHGIA